LSEFAEKYPEYVLIKNIFQRELEKGKRKAFREQEAVNKCLGVSAEFFKTLHQLSIGG